MLRYVPFLLVLGLWIYAFIDCLNTPEGEVRHLPKAVWVLIVVLFGYVLFGSVAWLIAGRPRRSQPGAVGRAQPGRGAPARWVAPDDNPEFLKTLGTGPGTDPGPGKDRDQDRREGSGEGHGEREGERDEEHGSDDTRS